VASSVPFVSKLGTGPWPNTAAENKINNEVRIGFKAMSYTFRDVRIIHSYIATTGYIVCNQFPYTEVNDRRVFPNSGYYKRYIRGYGLIKR